MELRELLQEFGYNSEETPIVVGSALCALEVSRQLLLSVGSPPLTVLFVLMCRITVMAHILVQHYML